MRNLRAAVIAALSLLALAAPLQAQDVTLTSRDGKVEVGGTLLGYDGEFYRLQSIYGVLTLDGSGVVCAGPGCPDLQAYVAEVRIKGAQSVGRGLLPDLLEGFAEHEELLVSRVVRDDNNFTYELTSRGTGLTVARVGFELSTSEAGFAGLLAGSAEIALSIREALPTETRALMDADLGDLTDARRSRIIALDGLVAVVANSNPVRVVSPQMLAAILRGEITNWQALGGVDASIAVYSLDPRTGFGAEIMRRLPGAAQTLVADAQIVPDGGALSDAVARNPYAIGITRYSEVGNARALAFAGGCGFEIYASRAALKSEDYPLTAPLFLYTSALRLPKTIRDFLRFLQSPEAQRIVARAGFVDQKLEEIALDAQGARFANAIARAGQEIGLEDLQELVAALGQGVRLSLSFRFEAGSSALDAQSRANVRRLAGLLESGRFDGQELLFAGFSDGDGAADVNRRIALRRADAVLAAVSEAAETMDRSRVKLRASGFGEAMPIACDD
ncbi:MAG: substrate-binding domain-containing protein, partial [Halocynthiibacter sp.]